MVAETDAERRRRVDELNQQAHALRRIDYDRLRLLAEEAYELAAGDDGGSPYDFGMAAALNDLAHRSCMLGEYETSLSQTAQALALLEPLPPGAVRCELLHTRGWAHFYLGDHAEALEQLLKALAVADEIGDRGLRAYVLDGIANVHSARDHPELALECQEEALTLHRDLGDRDGEAVVLNNIVYTYLDLGDHERALDAAETVLRYATDDGRPYLRMAAFDTLAQAHHAAGRLDAAEAGSRESLELALEHGSEPDEMRSLLLLGRIAHRRGALDEAAGLVEGALELAERLDSGIERFSCHELLSAIHEERRDFETALSHYKLFHGLRQAKINEDTENRFANLKLSHQVETARKDAEIHRLRSLALEREVEERRLAQAALEARASLDPLTGLYNRNHFPVLTEELRRALDRGEEVSLLLCDIDHFKGVNDTHGHAAGDQVLAVAARQLELSARKSDLSCRYGGDEFLVLLPGVGAEAAREIGERFRRGVAAVRVRHGQDEIGVTVTVGTATTTRESDAGLERLIERADGALYAAKQAGRDRVGAAERTSAAGGAE